MEKTVLPIHFEDRSGVEFERLTFAYVAHSKSWDELIWLGQTGSDGGRDIWGKTNSKTYCYLCANYAKLTFTKVKGDLKKLIDKKTLPDLLIVVCGGRVTSNLRKSVKEYANINGIKEIEIWGGVEFEEKLRKETPSLIKRFIDGEAFPDSPKELIYLSKETSKVEGKDIIDLIVECFDRPAFTTPFKQEASIPDFKKAIEDTIAVLNTGVHRLRDGTVIRKIPSRHAITDPELKSKLQAITNLVVKLRDSFSALIKSGDIRPCGCQQPDCPVYMMSDKATTEMDKIRGGIFEKLRDIKPEISLKLRY